MMNVEKKGTRTDVDMNKIVDSHRIAENKTTELLPVEDVSTEAPPKAPRLQVFAYH